MSILLLFLSIAILTALAILMWRLLKRYLPPNCPRWGISILTGGVMITLLGCLALTLDGGIVKGVVITTNRGDEYIITSPPVPMTNVHLIRDSVPLSTLRVMVNAVQVFPCSEVRYAATYGPTCLAVDVTFANTSTHPVQIWRAFSSIQDDARPSNQYVYSLPLAEAALHPSFMKWYLKPGQSTSGVLFYEVPHDTRQLFWIYQEAPGGSAAVIKITGNAIR